MANGPPVHQFDETNAARYLPRGGFEKTAVLVEVSDPESQAVIDTRFGEQRLSGAFYAVEEGDGLYGAARHEFEQTHTPVGANRWVKSSPVLAYRTDVSCVVDTVVDEHIETTVNAQPGDWIVRQHTGEVMVIGPAEFDERYVGEASE